MSYLEKLESLLQEAKTNKQNSGGDNARYWAIVVTDLEKILAFVNQYLVKESE